MFSGIVVWFQTLCSRMWGFFCFFFWVAADVTGSLKDRYECLLWQENCCTIFLYWRWASSLKRVQLEDHWWGKSAAIHEQRRQLGLSVSRQTTAMFVNRQKGGQRSWLWSWCTSGPTEPAVMWSCVPPLCLFWTLSVLCACIEVCCLLKNAEGTC